MSGQLGVVTASCPLPGGSCPAASPAAVPHVLSPPEMWGARCAQVEAERSESDGATGGRMLDVGVYPQRSSAGKRDTAAVLGPRPGRGTSRAPTLPCPRPRQGRGLQTVQVVTSPPGLDSQSPLPPRATSPELVGDWGCSLRVPRAHTPSTPPTVPASVTNERLGKTPLKACSCRTRAVSKPRLQSAEPHAHLQNQHPRGQARNVPARPRACHTRRSLRTFPQGYSSREGHAKPVDERIQGLRLHRPQPRPRHPPALTHAPRVLPPRSSRKRKIPGTANCAIFFF